VILRCLDVDPRNRPASALAVAAALPGGDPLAAALAAGDTPTPGMVAASGDTEGISVRAAVIWLAVTLAGLVVVVGLGAKTNVLRQTPFENSPDVLTKRARDLIQSFGYAEPPADSDHGFHVDDDYRNYVERNNPAAFRDQLARGQPALIYFWYRQGPQDLLARNEVSLEDPPPVNSGMVGLKINPQGRLIQFDAVPPQVEGRADSFPAPDWPALFTAAGLDMARFTHDEPQWLPLAGFDARAAWTGSYAQSPELPLRVEAASWRGKPVFFRLIGPWSIPERMHPADPLAAPRGLFLVIFAVCLLAAFFAWRNFHAGRGDIQGATRLAAFVLGVEMIQWLCTAHHVSTVGEMGSFIGGLNDAAFAGGVVWILYMAVEPYVRRRWPQSMITWSRVLGGGFRDPLVGGQTLAAIAMGIGLALISRSQELHLRQYGSFGIQQWGLTSLLDARRMLGVMPSVLIIWALGIGLFNIFLLFLLRMLFRRHWLAAAVFPVLFSGLMALIAGGHPVIGALNGVLAASLFLPCMLWCGVLGIVVFGFVGGMLQVYPLTTDFSVWYAGSGMFAIAVVMALAIYAFHTAVAGRPLFEAGFLESD
jgi:serine/threonine-protein kinase